MGKKKKDHAKLKDIPSDSDEEIDSQELAVLNSILSTKSEAPEEYHGTLKYVLYGTAIFALLSLPFTDRIIELAMPIARSWLILLGVKIVVFFIVFYIAMYIGKSSASD